MSSKKNKSKHPSASAPKSDAEKELKNKASAEAAKSDAPKADKPEKADKPAKAEAHKSDSVKAEKTDKAAKSDTSDKPADAKKAEKKAEDKPAKTEKPKKTAPVVAKADEKPKSEEKKPAAKPVEKKAAKPAKAEKKPVAGLVAIIAAIIAIVGSAFAIPQLINQPEPAEPETSEEAQEEEQPAEEETPAEEEQPAEETPAEEQGSTGGTASNNGGGYTGSYSTPSYMPKSISIPSLGIYASVISVGKNGNAMDVPRSEYQVGWYNQSVLPGAVGASIMTAHGGYLGNGIFKTLPNIKVGAEITITMVSGAQHTYTVVETVTKNAGSAANSYMPTIFRPVSDGVPTLSLITCTGEWIRSSQSYTQRFFVRAIKRN